MTSERMSCYDKLRDDKQSDSSQGQWCVSAQDVNIWVDTSSLAMSVLLEPDDVTLEDVCWL